MSKTSVRVMGELERLAQQLGNIVTYENNSQYGVETLAYIDQSSQITAAEYASGDKKVFYHINISKVEFYLSCLKQLSSSLGKRIQHSLVQRRHEMPPTDGSQLLVGETFAVDNFTEISDIIYIHELYA